MSFRIRKAVFPVAGLGTRFLPATKTVPKEMLPVIDKPLIQYAVDEITIAGNLRQMFMAIEAVGADIDRRSHISIGSVLVGKMMVAGES